MSFYPKEELYVGSHMIVFQRGAIALFQARAEWPNPWNHFIPENKRMNIHPQTLTTPQIRVERKDKPHRIFSKGISIEVERYWASHPQVAKLRPNHCLSDAVYFQWKSIKPTSLSWWSFRNNWKHTMRGVGRISLRCTLMREIYFNKYLMVCSIELAAKERID